MTTIVVSNTSPISNLALLGSLAVVAQLYEVVYIPEAVVRELQASPLVRPHLEVALKQGFLREVPLRNREHVRLLQHILDDGESEAIALAQEQSADLLLIDERAGRTVATNLGLEITGVLGILLEAKTKTLLPRVEPLLTNLQAIGFRMSPALVQTVLQAAGEA